MTSKPAIRYTTGDATDPPRGEPAIIVHVCNDIGAWGKGFVLALSRRWKQPEQQYRAWFQGKLSDQNGVPFALGEVQIVAVEDSLWVANLVGQSGIRRRGGKAPIRYEAVRQGLEHIADAAKARGASVSMPRIGCGLAGGRWENIGPLVQRALADQGISVTVYDPPTPISPPTPPPTPPTPLA